MGIKPQPDFREELERLEYTKEKIEQTLEKIENNEAIYQENIREAMVDLDYLDSSQSYITVLTNSELMKADKNTYRRLEQSQKKPYFCRIDFQEEGSPETKKLYIGKAPLFDDQKQIIVDWRSPIANVYYDGRLGDVSYKTPRGLTVNGSLKKKRQYTIENGVLENYMDIDITTNDAFLQASLDTNADSKLKDIAATIQSEQNRVIRCEVNGPLIVQGVAGSGKTTIALHRVAYLIYSYGEQFTPENFLIIAPNRLFINYISEVLPELGVEQIKQTTYVDYFQELLGVKVKVRRPDEKLVFYLEHSEEESLEALYLFEVASFKGSLNFKKLIDNYLEFISRKLIPSSDLQLEGHIIYQREDVERLFFQEYDFLPFFKRIDMIKKVLANKLKNARPKIFAEIEEQYNRNIEKIRYSMPDGDEKLQKLVAMMDQRDHALKRISDAAKTLVNRYIAQFQKRKLMEYYQEILSPDIVKSMSCESLEDEIISFMCSRGEKLLKEKQIEYEDLAPLAYLNHRLFGFKERFQISHVIIDEAQDFSIFQFEALKTILNTTRFTILGDMSQSIHSYRGIKSWEEVLQVVFPDAEKEYLTLVQSYRTTIEIMDAANHVIHQAALPNTVLAKPVVRHGSKPIVQSFKNRDLLVSSIEQELELLTDSKYKSVALICKTLEECKKLKDLLVKKKIKVETLVGDETEYKSGILIVPVYVAKGLEFDVVMIVGMEESYSNNHLDSKLMYVAMTRTLHKLYIFHTHGTMPLLEGISHNLLCKRQEDAEIFDNN